MKTHRITNVYFFSLCIAHTFRTNLYIIFPMHVFINLCRFVAYGFKDGKKAYLKES